ncbi:hypothetical protein Hanom_Chr01g00073341 [Helianthus anomalus]
MEEVSGGGCVDYEDRSGRRVKKLHVFCSLVLLVLYDGMRMVLCRFTVKMMTVVVGFTMMAAVLVDDVGGEKVAGGGGNGGW